MYNYTGEEGDLSFSEGDTISVTTAEGDWWEGSCRGETGPFPANYVKKKEAKDEVGTGGFNPFTPKSDQYQISPAASPEI